MPSLTRIPFVAPGARAVFNPTASTTFTALNSGNEATYTVAVPRNFKPYAKTDIFFTQGLPVGVTCSGVRVTGNAPNYTASYTLFNSTSGTLTPTAQQVIIWQA